MLWISLGQGNLNSNVWEALKEQDFTVNNKTPTRFYFMNHIIWETIRKLGNFIPENDWLGFMASEIAFQKTSTTPEIRISEGTGEEIFKTSISEETPEIVVLNFGGNREITYPSLVAKKNLMLE